MKIIKIFFYNFLVLFTFIILFEIFFGYWFDKDNFGPYMREHRMKNQRIEWSDEKEKIVYFYRKNYYGFRGEDTKPSDIDAIIMGGSVIDERYKPEKYTITGFLNKKLEKEFNIKLTNAGSEGQSTKGMVLSFKNWLFKLDDFKPKFILFYIGLNDTILKESRNEKKIIPDGHLLNPEKKEILIDNIKSRSILYDSIRIFKFKYLPREGFVKYDGKISAGYKKKFNNTYDFIDFDKAEKMYDAKKLQEKYKNKIKNYLHRIDMLYKFSKDIGSIPIFITGIDSYGYIEALYMLHSELITHCKLKNYNCLDIAKNINGKVEYWRDGTHTTKEGSNIFANEIYIELKEILAKHN